MCNFNQVNYGMQRCHPSCCRRRMHQIVADPCCSSEHNRTPKESIEMCWPRTCPEINGTAKIPAVEKTSTGEQLSRKSLSSTPKIPDPSKTNPLPKKISPAASQRKCNNILNDNSVSSTSKKLCKGSPVQANLSSKGSVKNSVKMARLSGGSLERNRKTFISPSCEKDSLMSVYSSEPDCGSPMSISFLKTTRKCKKLKPSKSKFEPQDTDLKALERSKPKRKKTLQRRWPTRSSTQESLKQLDEANTQENNDDDGVWFECNLPFRVNIPLPIAIRNLFGLQSYPKNACQGDSIVPERNCGNSLTTRNALPAPVPEPQPQPATTKRVCRRLKTRSNLSPSPSPSPSPCPCPCPCACSCHCPCSCACETSTQTGVEQSDLLRCLYEIKNQLAAKSGESRCFAEKSTYVRTLHEQNKAREGAKRREELPAKMSKASAAASESSNSVLIELRTPKTKTKKTEKKPKKTQSGSLTSVSGNSSKSSLNEVSKRPTKTKKSKPKKIQSGSSTNVSRNSSKSSLKEVPKPPTKIKKAKKPKEPVSISSNTSCSCVCPLNEVQEPPINTSKSGEKPTKSKKKEEEKEEKIPLVKNSIMPKKPEETVESFKDKDMKKNHISSDPEFEVEKKQVEPQVDKKKSKQIQKEREWIDSAPPIAWATPRLFPNECGMCPGLEYQRCCMNHGYNAGSPSMYQAPQYSGHCYQQSWPNCQRNAYLWNNTPQTACLYQGQCSPTATCEGSLPRRPEVLKCEQIDPGKKPSASVSTCLPTAKDVESMPHVEVKKSEKNEPDRKPSAGFCHSPSTATCIRRTPCEQVPKCEQIKPVRKPSVGFCQRPQVVSEYSYPTTHGSQSQSSCMDQSRTPGQCSQRCKQNWTVPISSSTEYNRKALLKRALCRNDSPMVSLDSRFPTNRCNSKSSAKSICFRVCPSQPQRCNENGNNNSEFAKKQLESNERSMAASCRTNHQKLRSDRISSGEDTTGIEASQFSSGSRLVVKEEYYFPLTDKNQRPNRSSKFQKKSNDYQRLGALNNKTANTISVKVDHSERDRSLNHDIVIYDNKRQSNACGGSGKIREVCPSRKPTSQPKTKDNMSYNQNQTTDGTSEDHIIVSFTNRSFSINSAELDTSASDDKQRISHKPPTEISTNEDLASQYSEKTLSWDHSLSELIKTDEEDDIDEAPSTSWKNFQKFESKPMYLKFKRQSSTERSDLNQVSESLGNISSIKYSKHRPMPCTRHVSGMCKRSNSCEKQTKKQLKSSQINIKNPVLVNKKKRSFSAPGFSGASVLRDGKSRSETQYLSPRNQIPEKVLTLTQGSNNVQETSSDTELDHSKHIPSNKFEIRKNDNRKIPEYSLKQEKAHQKESSDTGLEHATHMPSERMPKKDNKDIRKIPDYSLKADMMQEAKRGKECRCFIPIQELERTHQNDSSDMELEHATHIPPERIPKKDNRKDKDIRKIPDYSLKADMMQEAKQRKECRCFIPSQQQERTHQNDSSDMELEHETHIPPERIPKKDNRKDKDIRKVPEYSLKADMMPEPRQRKECRCFIPRQQQERTHQNDSSDMELEHETHIPPERIPKKDNRKDKDIRKVPVYSLKADIMPEPRQRKDCRCFIPSQQQERTHQNDSSDLDLEHETHTPPERIPKKDNRKDKDIRKVPVYSLKADTMQEAKQRKECRCFIPSQQQERTHQNDSSDLELEHEAHTPPERIPKKDNRKDKDIRKVPEHSLKAGTMQEAKQRKECRCFIPSQQQERTHQNDSSDMELEHATHTPPEKIPKSYNRNDKDMYKIPDYSLKQKKNYQAESSDLELEHATQTPPERIQKNYKRNDKDMCKIPDYNLRASMMQAKKRNESRCFIPCQELERTHQNEISDTELEHAKHIPSERIPKNDNRKDKEIRKIPDYSLKQETTHHNESSDTELVHSTHTPPESIPKKDNRKDKDIRKIPDYILKEKKPHQKETSDLELEHATHTPPERIPKTYNRNNKDMYKIPDYSLKASMMQAKKRNESRCFIPCQELERTHQNERSYTELEHSERIPKNDNRKYKKIRKFPDYSLKQETTHQDESSDTELVHTTHIPSERIPKKDNRNDKDMCKIPDYSLKASMMQAKKRNESRRFIPCQQLERTHQNERSYTELEHSERIPKNDNQKDKENRKIPDYILKQETAHHQKESSDTELEHATHIPSEKIPKKYYRNDKDICKIPDYSLKASMMQAKKRSECRCFIPSQQLEGTHTVPRHVPDYQNIQHRSPRNVEYPNADYQDSRQNPPMIVPRPMKNRNTIDCQPDECFRTDPSSDEMQTESDELYQVPETRGQPRAPLFQERLQSPCRQIKKSPHMLSPHDKDIPKTRLRNPSSDEKYFHGYFSIACKGRPTTHGNSTSDSSRQHSSTSKSSISFQAKETPVIYPENRNKSRYINGNNTQIKSSETELIKGNSDSESEGTEDSTAVVCKRTTDIETLKTVTLLKPRRLRCNESSTIWNSDMGTGNTVLLEISTTCKKDNLLQTCARPPSNCLDHKAQIARTNIPVQSPNLHPQNVSSFKQSYLIDPGDHWSRMKSPATAPGPSCQLQLQMQIKPRHPGYHPQLVKDAIKKLPIGFYDQTIQHYNVIRMNSDFQVPPFGSEVIQAVRAFPQSHCGCPACPYGHPIQPQFMRPVQDFNRPFFLPSNQIQPRLPMGSSLIYPRHSKYKS